MLKNFKANASKTFFRAAIVSGLFLLTGCTGGPVAWWASVNKKVIAWATAEEEYKVLKKKYADLEERHYRLEREYQALVGDSHQKSQGEMRLHATGSEHGKTSADIHYVVPTGLDAEKLSELAEEHMKEKRFSEAAATYEALFAHPEGAALQGPESYYLAGIAWYQLENYKKAKELLTIAKKNAAGDLRESIRKKVDLWFRVIDRKNEQNSLHKEIASHVKVHEPSSQSENSNRSERKAHHSTEASSSSRSPEEQEELAVQKEENRAPATHGGSLHGAVEAHHSRTENTPEEHLPAETKDHH